MKEAGRITDVPGVLVGHFTDGRALTGCTAILLPPGATAGASVGGSAPATRDTLVLGPDSRIDEVHAILFTGGSAYGLDAAGGVMRLLERRGIGHETAAGLVPIVPCAAIYDLNRGDPSVRPGPAEGEAAAAAASVEFETGLVGAGTGATCGKWRGMGRAVPAGIGTASMSTGGLVMGAIAVVNPVGDVVAADGSLLLGSGREGLAALPSPGEIGAGRSTPNTVLVAVATSGRLDKAWCHRAASRIQDDIARAVFPSRTKHDGDAGFFVSCGNDPADLDLVLYLVSEVTAAAIRGVATR